MSNRLMSQIPKTRAEAEMLCAIWQGWKGTGNSQPIPPKLSAESLGESFEFSVNWFMCHYDWCMKYNLPWRNTFGTFRGLEIGCYEGMSTVWLLEHLLTDEDVLVSIDFYDGLNGPSWIEIKERAERNIAATGKKRLCDLITGRSDDILNKMEHGIWNFAYVDGDHSADQVFRDSAFIWTNLLAPGGMILWDDYFSSDKFAREGVRAGLKKFCENYNVPLRFVGYSAFAIR